MTEDEAREALAMKGALKLLEEAEETKELAEAVHRHAERLSNCASCGGAPTANQLLRQAISLLGAVSSTTKIAA